MPYMVSTAGLRMLYTDDGPRDAHPLVLIHGLMGTHAVWEDVAGPLVRAGRRVITYDLRGRGESEGPPTGYSLVEYGADLFDLMNHLALDSAVLCGHSLGGSIATELALTHPRRVDGMVLIDSALAGFPYSEQFLDWIRRLRRTVRDGGAPAGVEMWVDEHPFFGPLRHRHPDRFRRFRETARTYRANEFLHGEAPDLRNHLDHLREIPVPVLVLVGEEDVPDFRVIADTLARTIQYGEERVIPACGHMPPLEAPEAVVEAVEDWMARNFERKPA